MDNLLRPSESRTGNGLRISVITVCFNAVDTLARTILSVAAQDYPQVEHIIIDGGSTDGTVELITDHENRLAFWVSEPDRGISDGMNKGITAACGELLIFINADDALAGPTALTTAAALISSQPPADFYACCILFGEGTRAQRRCPRPFGPRMRFKTGLLHQGVLCRRSALEQLGGYDVAFSYALDYDLFLRAYLAGMTLRTLDCTIAFMSAGGLSTGHDWPSVQQRLLQERRIHSKTAGSSIWSLIYRLYWLLYMPFKRLRHQQPPRARDGNRRRGSADT